MVVEIIMVVQGTVIKCRGISSGKYDCSGSVSLVAHVVVVVMVVVVLVVVVLVIALVVVVVVVAILLIAKAVVTVVVDADVRRSCSSIGSGNDNGCCT